MANTNTGTLPAVSSEVRTLGQRIWHVTGLLLEAEARQAKSWKLVPSAITQSETITNGMLTEIVIAERLVKELRNHKNELLGELKGLDPVEHKRVKDL